MNTQRIQLTTTTHSKTPEATYGVEHGVPFIELRERNDRWAIYGNCRSNVTRIIREIAVRGIKVSSEFMALLTLTA
jgi:hypothetical protein